MGSFDVFCVWPANSRKRLDRVAPIQPSRYGESRLVAAGDVGRFDARLAAQLQLDSRLALARRRQHARWAGGVGDSGAGRGQIGELFVFEGQGRTLGQAMVARPGKPSREVAPVGRL